MAARRRFYIDSSAYLAILLREPGYEKLKDEIDGQQLLSSTILALEARRTLVRLARDGILTSAKMNVAIERLTVDLDVLILRDLTLDLCASGEMPAVSTPRSLDLAHLRTALWFHGQDPLARFISLDDSQSNAARELGLPV